MKCAGNNLNHLTKIVVAALLAHDDEVHYLLADGHYILDAAPLTEVVRKALEDA